MALKSWLASLKDHVSNVSGVQAPIHAALGRYVTETADVSGVSASGGMMARDTADTAEENQTYQAQPAWVLGCTGDTADTPDEIDAEIQTTEIAATHALSEPTRLFRQRGPWLTGTEQSAAQKYLAHHFNCRTCIAAGRGTQSGKRCAAGIALWRTYSDSDGN